MKFKAGSFYIQLIPEAANQFELRNGYISKCGRYGFHKDGAFWIVSDIASGMRIHKARSRKACAEYCENFKGHIVAAKGTEKYKAALHAMVGFKKDLVEA